MSSKLSYTLIAFAFCFITNLSQAQVVSYGEKEPEEQDSIKVARAAPVFKAQGYYNNLEGYLEDELFKDPRTRFTMGAMGGTALISFTIDKYGFPKKVVADCSDPRLILPLQNVLDSVPRWKPGIKNDKNASTKMQFYYSITKVEAGQFVIKEERMPPKFDKTTRNIKIVIVAVCVSALIAAWAIF